MMDRRRFLHAGLVGAGVLGLGACASAPRITGRPRVVVVGGGFGGATLARYLRLWGEGRVDVVLYTRADGILLARELGLYSVAPLSPSLRDVDLYLYLNRKHEPLVPRLAQALREMKADGSYNRILATLKVE